MGGGKRLCSINFLFLGGSIRVVEGFYFWGEAFG